MVTVLSLALFLLPLRNTQEGVRTMARPLRIEFSGALYHIISRGIGKMTIFHKDADWKKFIDTLDKVIHRCNWICHAYCLMGNHYHLLVETPDPNLSRGMKHLNQIYSQYYNWKYHRVGPVLQGRYKAYLVEKEARFLDNSRYIVNNPAKAKLVEHPSDWPWSSYRSTVGTAKCPSYLETAFLLGHFSSSRKKARKMYEDFVLAGINSESPLKEAKNQIFLGSDSFVQEVMKHAKESDEIKNVPREQKFAGRPVLDKIFDLKTLHSKKTRNTKIQHAYLNYGYTLREIADHLNLNPNYLSFMLGKMKKI